MVYEIEIYETSTGKKPFDQWFKTLKDVKAKSLIVSRLDRIKLGNFGDVTPVGDGIHELRFHFGPGYRIYYAKIETQIILLMCGGAKKTQQKDIEKAKQHLKDFILKGN